MQSQTIIQFIFVLAVMTFSTATFGIDPPTACPPITTLQQSGPSLDEAYIQFGNYAVISSHPAFNFSGWDWAAGVMPVLAENKISAIAKAKEFIKNVFLGDEKPTDLGTGEYVCHYATEGSYVMAITIVNHGKSFDFTRLNIHNS